MNKIITAACGCGNECECDPCRCGGESIANSGCNNCDPCTCGSNCNCSLGKKVEVKSGNGCCCGESCVCVSCNCGGTVEEKQVITQVKKCCH